MPLQHRKAVGLMRSMSTFSAPEKTDGEADTPSAHAFVRRLLDVFCEGRSAVFSLSRRGRTTLHKVKHFQHAIENLPHRRYPF